MAIVGERSDNRVDEASETSRPPSPLIDYSQVDGTVFADPAPSPSTNDKGKLENEDAEGEGKGMDLRRNMFPKPFSFFVGSTFEGARREQQTLLELEDTTARLRRERDTLRKMLNYLTTASAVKDVFPSSLSTPLSSSSA